MYGSLIRPFQPTVVRGFSKYTRMTRYKRVAHFGGECFQALGVFEGGLEVVDRAGADHDEQAMVLAIENVANDFATLGDDGASLVRHRQLAFELGRSDQDFLGFDVEVFDAC